MRRFFDKKLFFFIVGVLFSIFLARSLSLKFQNYEENLMQVELERKILFLKKTMASKEATINYCLFESSSLLDACTQNFVLHESLSLYDMRIFRNDTLIFEKNINPDISWKSWIKSQNLEVKNSIFVFYMKPTKEHLKSLKSNFPRVIFMLGLFSTSIFTILIWFYQQLFIKKEELRKVKDEVSFANAILQKKNRELEEYAYVVAHDLQEPLNTINGFVDVLKEDHQLIFKNKEVKQHFTLISNASSRMRLMIKELLAYTKLGQDRETEFLSIKELINEILIDLTHLISKSGATIIIPENLPIVKGYKIELKLLFQNLIINAIKYKKSDTKPIIKISYKSNSVESEFTIEDNGIGIDKKYQDVIFKLFHRLHNSNKYSGSGIGLTKCKKIIDLHNGSIWVDSIPSKGSKFHFIIPSQQ